MTFSNCGQIGGQNENMAVFMKLENRANPHEYWGLRVFELWEWWNQPLVPKSPALPAAPHPENIILSLQQRIAYVTNILIDFIQFVKSYLLLLKLLCAIPRALNLA